MTSKERMMVALHRERPDRMPMTLHQWQPYHLQTYMGGISALEAFERLGMDASIQYFQDMGQFWRVEEDFGRFSHRQWRDEARVVSSDPDNQVVFHTIHTPGGDLTYKTAGNRKTTWVTEYLIKRDEDVDLIDRYMPVPALELAPVVEAYDQLGDRGILRGFVWGDQAGCWQHACCLMDVNDLILKAADEPAWVHRLLQALLKKKLRWIESMEGAKFDLVETGGGAGSSTVISPKMHEEFCLPYDRIMHRALRELGFLTAYHTCGGTYGLEELIVANGCDASETLAPKSIGGNQEPWEFADKIRGRLALIGGVDQFNVVSDGPVEKIRATVRELFEKVGGNGGYICSLSDHFFETPVEHLAAYAAAGRECVYAA